MFTNVVVGIDGHAGGRDAIALAHALGAQRLTLACAYAAEPWRGTVAEDEELLRLDAERVLDDARRKAGGGVDVVAVGDPSPARALQRLARSRAADLLVVGSAHHGPVGRLVLGDVGRVVLQGAPCPVAIAPRGRRVGDLRRIIVGFDGSAAARHALGIARGLADDHDVDLTVHVVWESPAMPVVAAAGSLGTIDRASLDQRRQAEHLLKTALATLAPGVSGSVLHGRPALELAGAAASADLLVVGSHGWGPVRRVILGSTSDWLAHHAPCALLVVPRPGPVADESALESEPPTRLPQVIL